MREWFSRARPHLRIVFAIVRKDLIDALHNRTILAVVGGTLLLVLTNQAIPYLVRRHSRPILVVLEPSGSTLARQMAENSRLNVVRSDSWEQMNAVVTQGIVPSLGLIVPEGFADGPDGQSELTGYVAHWAGGRDTAEMVSIVEEEVSTAVGRPVAVSPADERLYPPIDSGSQGLVYSSSLFQILGLFVVLLGLVPTLLMEEKEDHTMEVLLLSPASAAHVVAGKAIVGFVYGGLVALAVGLPNAGMVTHVWVMAAASLVAIILAVGIGVLIGSLFDDTQNAGLGMGALIMLLLMPLLARPAIVARLGPAAETALSALPSVLLMDVMRQTYVREVDFGAMGWRLGALAVMALAVYGLVVWRLRREMQR